MITSTLHIEANEKSLLCSDHSLRLIADNEGCTTPVRRSSLTEKLRDISQSILLFIVPSFWHKAPVTQTVFITEKLPQSIPCPKSSTQYLDGVRGVASLIVFIFHFAHMVYPGTNKGFGIDGQVSVWQLPMIRLVYSGAAMVSIFFVVSGYVLSHRFVEMIRAREFERLYMTLTSLAFRRAFRLFVPALVSILLQFAVASVFPHILPRKINGKEWHPGTTALLQNVSKLTNPWTWEPYMDGGYNPQLWSIALEYRGSMVIFLMLLTLCRTELWVRLLVETAVIVHSFAHKRWDVALFIAGMLMAELDVHVHSSPARIAFMRRKATKFCLVSAVIIGVWLSGFPRDKGIQSYGYGFLRQSWPYGDYRRRFWLGIAAILIVAPMPYLPAVQQFFNSHTAIYLGKISFSLYLIHGLGNRTVATWLIHITRSMLGKKGYWNSVTSFAITALVYVPLIIWWADIFWRAVDRPSTTLAKWIEQRTRRSG